MTKTDEEGRDQPLGITHEAARVIRELVGSRPSGGLRLSLWAPEDDGGRPEISLGLVSAPAPTDRMVAFDGARVFVDEHLLELIAERTLDVRLDEESGIYRFRLRSTRKPSFER